MMPLSPKDQEVFSRIFNPSLFIPVYNDDQIDVKVDSDLNELSELRESKKIEIEAIKLAEQSTPSSLSAALTLINEAIQLESFDASLLNNKAQILRLIGGRDDEAFECLDQVINSTFSVNEKVLRQSSAQRAWLHFKSGRNDEAFIDFERASKLGCLESKRMAVRCNPYATMCNQMMQELIGSNYFSK